MVSGAPEVTPEQKDVVTVKAGQSILLTAGIQGHPQPSSKWFHNDTLLTV